MPKPKKNLQRPVSHWPDRKYILALFAVVSVAALLYLNAFRVPWIFDDRPNIVDNRTVHVDVISFEKLKNLVQNSFSGSPRYFSYFTFAVNFYVGRLNVFGYHLVNVLIHSFTGILVFWFVHLTLNLPSQKERYGPISFRVALLASLLFVAHPVQTQAVTYIVQRMTSMATMFYLLAMVLYIKGRLSEGTPQILFYVGTALSGLLALFSKENAFVLPVFIVLYELLFFRSREAGIPRGVVVKVAIVFLLLGIIGAVLLGTTYIGVIQEGYRIRDFTMSERVLTQFRVVLHYVTLVIFPHPSRLNLDYDFTVSKGLFSPVSTFLSLVIIVCLIGVAVWKRKAWPLVSFFILWYFGNLVIESSIFPLEMVYEHRLYLPSIGPICLFSLLCVHLWERWVPADTKGRELAFAFGVTLLLVPLSWGTIQRNRVWADEHTLWKDVVQKSPNKARPRYNLGQSYQRRGEVARAQEEYEIALKLDPRLAPAHLNLGVLHYNRGLLDQAAEQFKEALSIDPKFAMARAYLGEVYFAKGKMDEALAEFKEALKSDPANVRALNKVGQVYFNRGDVAGALAQFMRAVSLDPNNVEAHVNLAETYVQHGRLNEAVSEARRALRLNSDNPDTNTTLGIIFFRRGDISEAILAFNKALETDPKHVPALSNLGLAYLQQGKNDEAIARFRRVLAIRPDDEESHTNLGEALLAKGLLNEAIQETQKALQINPRSCAARLNLGRAYFTKGMVDQAIGEWKKALEINPKEARAHHNLAAAYYGKREYRLAIRHFDEAAALGFKVHPQLAEMLKPYRK